MKIVKVSYAKLRNNGDYENERIEMEAEMDTGDTVSKTLATLKYEVLRSLGYDVKKRRILMDIREALGEFDDE